MYYGFNVLLKKQLYKRELTDQKIKEFEKFVSYMYNEETFPTDTVQFALVIKSKSPIICPNLGYTLFAQKQTNNKIIIGRQACISMPLLSCPAEIRSKILVILFLKISNKIRYFATAKQVVEPLCVNENMQNCSV